MSAALNYFEMASPMAMAIMLSLPLFLFSLAALSRAYRPKTPPPPPQAGRSWPLIGHLHLLAKPQPTHITLSHLADKYGPIFTLKLGSNQSLVVSDRQIAKECLTTHDRVFATRPRTAAAEILGYEQKVIAFAPYGPHWRQALKIAKVELLSNNRLELLTHVREDEVRASIRELYQLCKSKDNTSTGSDKSTVDMSRWIGDVTMNLLVRMLVGMRVSDDPRGEKLKRVFRDTAELFGTFVVGDVFPVLRSFEIGGVEKRMRKTARELDEFAEEWLEEHKRKRESCQDRQAPEDFMDMMLDALSREAKDQQEAHTMAKAICMTFMLGTAAETTSAALTWALSLVLNNQEVLKKARAELEPHIGTSRLPNESDMKKVVYLQAILKETLRLYPPSPLSVAHVAMEDCTVNGYHVQAGTRLIVNFYKIHHDPNLWPNPLKFDPERFFTTHKEVDVRGQNFECLPFSSGRRICSGASLSLQIMQLTLASLLHGFEFSALSDEPIDMSPGAGITLHKATPLQLFVTPRLPDSCYV